MFTVPTRKPERVAEVFGGLAFCVVVLAAFAQLLVFSGRLAIQPWHLATAFIGGTIYLIVGLWSSRWTDRGNEQHRTVYFTFQIILVSTVILLIPGPGFFAVIALPLAAQAMVDLRPVAGVLINVGLYAVSVIAYWIPWGAGAAFQASVSFLPAFLFTAVFAYLTARAFRLRESSEAMSLELAGANERLRQQSEQAEELATARERNRLAREIHDGLGHYLTVINVQLEAARALLEREPARAIESIETATRLSREALDEVRSSVGDLRREATRVPLADRIRQLCTDAGLFAHCAVQGPPRSLPTVAEHALFRAAQEGLTNIRKHAGPTAAELFLDYREPGLVTLRVVDHGRTRAAAVNAIARNRGLGLRGMRERVELLNGKVTAGPHSAGGFELLVEIPG